MIDLCSFQLTCLPSWHAFKLTSTKWPLNFGQLSSAPFQVGRQSDGLHIMFTFIHDDIQSKEISDYHVGDELRRTFTLGQFCSRSFVSRHLCEPCIMLTKSEPTSVESDIKKKPNIYYQILLVPCVPIAESTQLGQTRGLLSKDTSNKKKVLALFF